MTSSHYARVINALCECVGNPGAAGTLLASGQIVVDDVAFALSPGGDPPLETLVIYCDFGEIDEDVRSIVQQNMLESNAYLFQGANSPCLAISPETGRALFMSHMTLSVATGESVRDCLYYFASVALDWRTRNWHLEATEKTRMRTLLSEMGRGL